MTRRHPRALGTQALGSLAVLLLLAGCAATPSLGGAQRYGQTRPATVQGFPEAARARQQVVDVDFEAPTPRRAEELRQRGVQLPRVSHGTGDPRAHRDFVDLRVTAVGYGISEGGYLLYCEGLPLPVLVPESHVDLGLTSAVPLSAAIYPDRDAALEDMAARGPAQRHASHAYYRGAGGALIVPTLFSPATTPRIARTMREVRKDLSETVQRDLKVLLLTLSGTKVVQGLFSRVVRVGSEPAPRPLVPQQPGRQSAAPAPATGAPAPAPGSLAPSPGLVRALTGNNPTPQVALGPRLPQDASVSPKVPRELPPDRPCWLQPHSECASPGRHRIPAEHGRYEHPGESAATRAEQQSARRNQPTGPSVRL